MRNHFWKIALLALLVSGLAALPFASHAQKKGAKVTIENKSDWDLDHLYIAPVNTTKWGPDQFGDANVQHGESFTITNIPCDTYDIKLVDEDGDECVIEDVDLCKTNNVWTITNKMLQKVKAAKVTIENKSDWDLHHFYLTPVDRVSWGPDQFGDHVVKHGESFTLTNIACDLYDIKLVDEDGDECIVEDVDLCKTNNVWTITNKQLLSCQGFGH